MTNSQLSTTEPKKKKKKNLSKQLEQEQNHKNGNHKEGYQQGWGGRRMGEKIQGIKRVISMYKIDRRRLRIVWEMEKPKTLYVWYMAVNEGGGILVGGGYRVEGNKVEKKMRQL